MYQAVFADIQISGAGTAPPVIGLSGRKIFLKPVEAAVAALAVILDFAINAGLTAVQRLHRNISVVNDAERACETELDRPLCDDLCILRITDAAADDGVDVHRKLSKLG